MNNADKKVFKAGTSSINYEKFINGTLRLIKVSSMSSNYTYLKEKDELDKILIAGADNNIEFSKSRDKAIGRKQHLNDCIHYTNRNIDYLKWTDINGITNVKQHYDFFITSYNSLEIQWEQDCKDFNLKYNNNDVKDMKFEELYEDLMAYKMLMKIHGSLKNYIERFRKELIDESSKKFNNDSEEYSTLQAFKKVISEYYNKLGDSPFMNQGASPLILVNEHVKENFERAFDINNKIVENECNKVINKQIDSKDFYNNKNIESLINFINNASEMLKSTNKRLEEDCSVNPDLIQLRKELSPINKFLNVYKKYSIDSRLDEYEISLESILLLKNGNQFKLLKEYAEDPLGLHLLNIYNLK